MYDYDSLKKIANNFNLPCKKYKKTLYNWNDFLYFYQKTNIDNKNNIEGYVLIDSNNFMVKLKTPYYLLWKKLRYYIYNNKYDKEMIFNNIAIDNLNFKNNEDKKEALNFIYWYFKNKENITIKNIIDLRDKYLFYKENNLI